jgi:hypothetical protein
VDLTIESVDAVTALDVHDDRRGGDGGGVELERSTRKPTPWYGKTLISAASTDGNQERRDLRGGRSGKGQRRSGDERQGANDHV